MQKNGAMYICTRVQYSPTKKGEKMNVLREYEKSIE